MLKNSLLRPLLCVFLTLEISLPRTHAGREIAWRNDTLASGQMGVVQAGFVQSDIGLAVFEIPCSMLPLHVRSVQAFWRSQGGSAAQLMSHVRVYEMNGDVPGSVLFSAEGVVVTGGYLNEFTPSDWVIDTSRFGIGFEYVTALEQTISTASVHLVTDNDGCRIGKNRIYSASSAQWLDPCLLGMNGDLAIRLVFEDSSLFCFGDSDCNDTVDLDDFASFQRCFSASSAARQECLAHDCDKDGDVDLVDLDQLLAGCFIGPNNACNLACSPCPTLRSAPGLFPQRLASASGYTPLPGQPFASLFTLVQVVVSIGIVSAAIVLFIGPCFRSSCRAVKNNQFRIQAINPDDFEQERINEALDWLLSTGDDEAVECVVWYDTHLARDNLFGTIKINHWKDREGFAASRLPLENRVVVHADFVTGSDWSPETLGLWLLAEWQHIDAGMTSEQQLEIRLKAFRQRVGLANLHPEIQHGFGEGSGG